MAVRKASANPQAVGAEADRVTVASPALAGVAGRHRLARVIMEKAGEQARLGGIHLDNVAGAVVGERALHLLP